MVQSNKTVVVIAIQLPPPYHGLSNVNKFVSDLIIENFANAIVINTSGNEFTWKRYLWKSVRTCKVIKVLLSNIGAGRRTIFYMSVSGGLGLAFELLPWLLAGIICSKRIMHHHSYNYITNRSLLMALMQSVFRRNISNIFLCNNHKLTFLGKYRRARKASGIVVSNDYLSVRNYYKRDLKKEAGLVIGHLSNLSKAKGFLKVMEVFDQLQYLQNITFRIAGPCHDKEIESIINDYIVRYPDNFFYDGAVYDGSKINWFNSLDIFLFPSSYKNETYPLVIVEAISNSVLPLTTDIACLPELNNPSFLTSNENFVDFSTSFIKRYIIDVSFKYECLSKLDELNKALQNNILKDKSTLLRQFII